MVYKDKVEISVEKLVSLVTLEVMKELRKQGVQIITGAECDSCHNLNSGIKTKCEKIDMDKYRTPILTENHIKRLHVLTGEVIVPKGTVITPKAKELIKEKGITIVLDGSYVSS
jgi:hypothetical protein